MAKKTNKTSHVLNLITNGNPQENESPEPREASAQETPVAAHSGSVSANLAADSVPANSASGQSQANLVSGAAPASEKKVIVVDDSETNRISDEIRDQLISHLEETENKTRAEKQTGMEMDNKMEPEKQAEPEIRAEEKPEVEPAAQIQAESQVQPESQTQPEAKAEPEAMEKPEAQTGQENPAWAKPVSEAEPGPKIQIEYRMVNVMEQILRRHNLEKQMQKYGVCMCSRCRADVLALALTRLPAKYVVVDESSVAPIIGYYENKYKVNILTQAIRACMDVKEHPRHKEGEH